jgi:hypothetical protein
MDFKITSEITFHPADLEAYLKNKGLMAEYQTLHNISLLDDKTLKLTFVGDSRILSESISSCMIIASTQMTHEHLQFLEQKVDDEWGWLSVRIKNRFKEVGILHLKDLTELKFRQLVATNGFGKKTSKELIEYLDKQGKGLRLTDMAMSMLREHYY